MLRWPERPVFLSVVQASASESRRASRRLGCLLCPRRGGCGSGFGERPFMGRRGRSTARRAAEPVGSGTPSGDRRFTPASLAPVGCCAASRKAGPAFLPESRLGRGGRFFRKRARPPTADFGAVESLPHLLRPRSPSFFEAAGYEKDPSLFLDWYKKILSNLSF